jgi:hypothetical protein
VVNASLNWASIVGIVLAVGGAFLYFMRSFKPALARDYDVFFAAIGLLCGGILFFQGWRLDPILQFGQFLLAATTVFFAYESVRLRGVTTEQARRSSYFDDEEPAAPFRPRGGLGGGRDWDNEPDRFDEPEPLRRRIPSRDEPEEDFYRPRRPSSRAAIPERAASRRSEPDTWDSPRRERGPQRPERDLPPEDGPDLGSRYSAGGRSRSQPSDFGARRRDRESAPETRRGSRPAASADSMPRSGRRTPPASGPTAPMGREAAPGVPQGSPLAGSGRTPFRSSGPEEVSDADFSPMAGSRPRPKAPGPQAPGPQARGPQGPEADSSSTRPPARDNSSRFDD